MKKIDTLFTGIGLFAVIAVTGAAIWNMGPKLIQSPVIEYPANKYGAFLAAQHAIYANDFDTAAKMSQSFQDRDLPIVRNTIILSAFLDGRLPDDLDVFKSESSAPAQIIFDAYLLQTDKWADVYARHKKDESALAAPLRIWSGVATGKVSETLKFVEGLKTNESWKSFVRGQIYAETGKPKQAAEQFAKVSIDFMNINDYLYIIAFYNEFDMGDAATSLYTRFTARPGGMFMLDSKFVPKWSDYSGYKQALAFSIVQNVSHTQIMLYTDLSLLLLRFAEITQGSGQAATNYYLGQYFFNNGGDFNKFFDAIDNDNPFYPFAAMKLAEKTGKITDMERVVRASPLFTPAITKLVSKYTQDGDKNKALRVINRALENENLSESGRAFFLKNRAGVYLTFGDLDNAQSDIKTAADILPLDTGILAIQSRIWSLEKRELETAYEYAIALVHKNPSDIESWDILGMVVNAKEGPESALEVLERVGQISSTCSVLFEHLGDLYAEIGDTKRARDSYLRAIDLSGDGMTVLPYLEKKLRDLK